MARGEAVSARLAIGVGCRAAARAEDIAALARQTLGARQGACAGLFTLLDKAHHANLRGAATLLGLPLVGLSAEALGLQTERLSATSAAAQKWFGVPSVAEASALAGAGEGAKIVASAKTADIVCAIAEAP